MGTWKLDINEIEDLILNLEVDFEKDFGFRGRTFTLIVTGQLLGSGTIDFSAGYIGGKRIGQIKYVLLARLVVKYCFKFQFAQKYNYFFIL